MPEELAPWPGAEVLGEVFSAAKGWAAASSDPPVAGELDGRAEKRIRELARAAGWLTNDLSEALGVFRGVLLRPDLARSPSAVLAYAQVAAWAEENGLPVTRFCFAALGGLNSPDDFRKAYSVGVLARDLARWNAALAWLEQAASAAARLEAWSEHVVAVLAFGNTLYRQGLYQQARSVLERALRLTRKHSVKELEGRALHDLMVIAVETRDTPAAESYARSALAAYGPDHVNVPALAHDLAFAWIRDGYAARALSVFQAVLPHVAARPQDRTRVLANIAHAAAVSGDRVLFDRTFSKVRQSSRDPAAAAVMPSAFLELAHGAAALAQWGVAEEAAKAALATALSRGEVDVISRADSLLGAITGGPGTPEAAARGTPAGGIATTAAPAREASDALAERLIRGIVINDVLRSADEARLHPSGGDLRREGAGPLTPFRAAQGHHTAFRRCAWSNRILEYATYRPAVSTPASGAWERVLHAESEGSPSFNRAARMDVAPPHVHDPSVPGGVREARPDEVPALPW